MIDRRVTSLAVAVFVAAICLPLSQGGTPSIHASPVNATFQVKLGCSLGNPPVSYAAHCGLTLGMTAHLKAVTNHALGGGYELWITGTRVTPSPAIAAGRTVCTSSPCLSPRFVRNGKSVTYIVSYDYQAWLVFHPSGTPIVLKKSNIVRVAWAPKAQVVVIQRVRTVGSIITVNVALTYGTLESEYLDLRIINGPGRFTTIGNCQRATVTNRFAATSCDINVNCASYRAQIEVEGRVVGETSGEVPATSEPLFLCRAVPLPTAGTTWVMITTPCTPNATTPTLTQVGLACYDPTQANLKVSWQVGASSATWVTPYWSASFQYPVPQSIPPGGADLSLSATATDLSGAGINAKMCVGSDTDFQVKNNVRCVETPEARGKGMTTHDLKTVTLLSFKASAGSKAHLYIGFQDGGTLEYTYQAK
jgi:hypothetical protein